MIYTTVSVSAGQNFPEIPTSQCKVSGSKILLRQFPWVCKITWSNHSLLSQQFSSQTQNTKLNFFIVVWYCRKIINTHKTVPSNVLYIGHHWELSFAEERGTSVGANVILLQKFQHSVSSLIQALGCKTYTSSVFEKMFSAMFQILCEIIKFGTLMKSFGLFSFQRHFCWQGWNAASGLKSSNDATHLPSWSTP
jgi:hypothetical protein